MANETATATIPTEATASTTEAPATLLASAPSEAGTQTHTAETPAATATETTATATTTADGKPAAEAAAKPAAQAPEKYEIKAPEGTVFDPAVLDAYTAAAKDADLSQDAAQKLIEKMAPALAARQADQVKAIHEEWRTASTTDKEFGGEKLTENLGVARKAYDSFATPELRKLLDETGMGNHPEVIRLMYRVGKAISEDKFVAGRPGGTGTVDPGSVLYDKTKKG